MIKKNSLFKKEYIDIFSPYSFEFLNIFIGQLGFFQKDYDEPKVKETVLSVLKFMFELDIIKINNWMNHKYANDYKMSSIEIIEKIDSLWFKGIQYPDFYGIAYFEMKEWYISKLEQLGMTPTTDWKIFVEEKIGGDLEKWIKENKS